MDFDYNKLNKTVMTVLLKIFIGGVGGVCVTAVDVNVPVVCHSSHPRELL